MPPDPLAECSKPVGSSPLTQKSAPQSLMHIRLKSDKIFFRTVGSIDVVTLCRNSDNDTGTFRNSDILYQGLKFRRGTWITPLTGPSCFTNFTVWTGCLRLHLRLLYRCEPGNTVTRFATLYFTMTLSAQVLDPDVFLFFYRILMWRALCRFWSLMKQTLSSRLAMRMISRVYSGIIHGPNVFWRKAKEMPGIYCMKMFSWWPLADLFYGSALGSGIILQSVKCN